MPIIQSVERALKIMGLFDENTTELKITEISSKMQMHKSTVHSLLKTLQLHGYIQQDSESGKYKLGLALLEKGQLLLNGFDIRTVAKAHLQSLSLQTGQTIHLAILDGNMGVYIDKVEGEKAAIRYSRIGRRVPLHSSAVGKVLAAFNNKDETQLFLQDYLFTEHTAKTITDKNSFLRELTKVRTDGFAVDNEENEPGVRCVATPIFDHLGHVSAAVSLSTVLSRVNDEEFMQFAELLKQDTSVISHKLGCPVNKKVEL